MLQGWKAELHHKHRCWCKLCSSLGSRQAGLCCWNRTGGSLQPPAHSRFVSFSPSLPGEMLPWVWLRSLFHSSIPVCSLLVWKAAFPWSAPLRPRRWLCTGRAAPFPSGPQPSSRSPRTAGPSTPSAARPSTGECWELAPVLHVYTSCCLALHVRFSNSCCDGWGVCVYNFQKMITRHWELDQVASCCGRMNIHWLWWSCPLESAVCGHEMSNTLLSSGQGRTSAPSWEVDIKEQFKVKGRSWKSSWFISDVPLTTLTSSCLNLNWKPRSLHSSTGHGKGPQATFLWNMLTVQVCISFAWGTHSAHNACSSSALLWHPQPTTHHQHPNPN